MINYDGDHHTRTPPNVHHDDDHQSYDIGGDDVNCGYTDVDVFLYDDGDHVFW